MYDTGYRGRMYLEALESEQKDLSDISEEKEDQSSDNDINITVDVFGSDTSDIQNEYDPREVERLNMLIASENSAIGEYFTAAKETNIDVLRRLYSDIGEEERFHSEQLTFAKSQITGEKYVPRDPDVKAEYEELLDMGVDEETAMTTAVDKVGLMNRERTLTPEDEIQSMEDIVSDMEMLEYTMYQESILLHIQTSPMIETLYERDQATAIMCEAFMNTAVLSPEVFTEAVVDPSENPKSEQKVFPHPIKALLNAIRGICNAIKAMGQKFTQWVVNTRQRRRNVVAWLKKNHLGGLFKNGVFLYTWDDQRNDFDLDTPVAYIRLLYDLTIKIANKCDCSVNAVKPIYNYEVNKEVNVSSIEQGIEMVNNLSVQKEKIVVTDKNEDAILAKIFGATDQKFDIATAAKTTESGKIEYKQSINVFNSLNAVLQDASNYMGATKNVLEQFDKMQSNNQSFAFTRPNDYATAYKQLEVIVKNYQRWIQIISKDITTLMKLNNEAVQLATANKDYDDSFDDISKINNVSKLNQMKSAYQNKLNKLTGDDPNRVKISEFIKRIDARIQQLQHPPTNNS